MVSNKDPKPKQGILPFPTNSKPPEDYRLLNEYPTLSDLLAQQTSYLRPIRPMEPYLDSAEYLDVQFRLLKEDLTAPLREGIEELTTNVNQVNTNLKLYKRVSLLYPLVTHNGITYRISFDASEFKGFPWASSKKMIFGSLLCISNDYFKTVIFATVANSDPKSLSNGLLDIRFLCDAGKDYCSNISFQFVESPAYFEAYRHVLAGLKEITPTTIPMYAYIVKCSNLINRPQYMCRSTTLQGIYYDLSKSLGCSNGANSINMFSSGSWPPQNQTTFNRSQYEAVKHALTKEFALIQGPPGTGKTFTALRIVDGFMANKKYWNKDGKTPLLIVCYTNHALDQFLTGLIKHGHKSIIRLGGRCCDELQEYTMKATLKRIRSGQSIDDGYTVTARMSADQRKFSSLKRIIYEKRDALSENLEKHLEVARRWEAQSAKGRLMRFSDLCWAQAINQSHKSYFSDTDMKCRRLKCSVFEIYLGILDLSIERLSKLQLMEDAAAANSDSKTDENIKDGETKEDDYSKIEVEGEAKMLLDRWVVDKDEFKPTKSEDPSKKDNIFQNFIFVDDKGFEVAQKSFKQRKKEVQENLAKHEAMTYEESSRVANPWRLEMKDRWRLYKYWTDCFVTKYKKCIESVAGPYEAACVQLKKVTDQEQEAALEKADIIAMTTTCAARIRHTLKKIKPKITVIEEAAEVFESHVVTTLTEGSEHVVLIGDHKQLRPNPAMHSLAIKYGLDISLFERMVNNKLTLVTLNVQHRMRPEIACLLKHIYPNLESHHSVHKYEKIKGIEKSLFFINHNKPEGNVGTTKSKCNVYEAQYVKSLCLYLLKQGYEKEQITILTGYSGQLLQLNKIMPKEQFEGLRITTIDNFQGEENEIILLSLVRSNDNNNMGFLSAENRVCVAMSRAKSGLYVVGNFDMLASANELWSKIVKDAKDMECFGNSLPLSCQNHTHTKIQASCCEDFDKAPEGGCLKKCGFQFECGHICEKSCHPRDKEHKGMYRCSTKCNDVLMCGHKCPGNCSRCKQGRLHVSCNKCCKELLVCSHVCNGPCTTDCPPCNKKCENRCGHMQCPLPCWEVCVPCRQPCTWRCPHLACNRRCSEICDRGPCNRPCSKILDGCKHPCIGFCGEPCPKLCRICDRDELQKIVFYFGNEEKPSSRFVQLANCEHIFEVNDLDKIMYKSQSQYPPKLKECPKCGTPIRQSVRYNNVVKRTLDEINEVKRKDTLGLYYELNDLRNSAFHDLRAAFRLRGKAPTDRSMQDNILLDSCSWAEFKRRVEGLKKGKSPESKVSDILTIRVEQLASVKDKWSAHLVKKQSSMLQHIYRLSKDIRNSNSLTKDEVRELQGLLDDLGQYVQNPNMVKWQMDDALIELMRINLNTEIFHMRNQMSHLLPRDLKISAASKDLSFVFSRLALSNQGMINFHMGKEEIALIQDYEAHLCSKKKLSKFKLDVYESKLTTLRRRAGLKALSMTPIHLVTDAMGDIQIM